MVVVAPLLVDSSPATTMHKNLVGFLANKMPKVILQVGSLVNKVRRVIPLVDYLEVRRPEDFLVVNNSNNNSSNNKYSNNNNSRRSSRL